MVIIGVKGFAKELLEVFFQYKQTPKIAFFDNLSSDLPELMYGKFPIIRDFETLQKYFIEESPEYVLGIGKPRVRRELENKITSLGGKIQTTISPFARIGHFGTIIQNGSNIMTGVNITNDVRIGRGCLINLNSSIGHDTIIGPFTEICPGTNISGNVKIGKETFIGTNVAILPNISIGDNVIIGAGTMVNKDIPNNSLAVGVPAVIKKSFS